jgi:hypothetical protein
MRPLAVAVALGVLSAPAAAQLPPLRGYYLNVGFAAAGTPLTDAGVTDFQRLRLMVQPRYGPVAGDVAYEQRLTLSTVAGGGMLLGLQPAQGGGDWLPLQGTLEESDHVQWRHRVDRLGVEVGTAAFAAVAGRQPISWATTLFLTPADPFMPFDPSDPFREYRRGVDALRLRAFPGPMSEIEAVVRPATFGDTTLVTALARARATVGPLDLTGWGGVVHEEASVSAGATATFWGAAWRGEGVLRWTDSTTVVRFTVGADRSFALGARTLYLTVEYQHDGYGAATAAALPGVLTSAPARRGELQVYGRDEAVLQASLDVHPLVGTDVLVIGNLGDGSVLLGPGVTYSAGNEVSLRGGAFFGLGTGVDPGGVPGSEYGLVPTSGYVSVTAFF